jgi:2-polyprenyl-6-hydroxyphenyl methylase/3-demethylubiquinone-9 3-methyltransferase
MQNVDPQEIAKFNQQAHQWWDLNGPFKTLHALNPLRLSYVQKFTSLANQQVLDVGCGGGIFSEALALAQAQVTGIDMAPAALEVAQQHAQPALSIHYQHSSVEAFAEQTSQQFDVVTCMELLEHVPDPQSVIQACSRLVKPGGWVFFSTLNRTFKAYLLAIIGAEYVLGLLNKGTHDYQKFIRPAELLQCAREAGLELQDIRGVRYQPLSQKFSLTHNVDVNYLVALRHAA